MKNADKISLYGILIAAAMIFSFIESLLPAFFAIPGMKLGLANSVNILALYILGFIPALIISLLRIILSSILFGTAVSFLYGIAGGILSLIIMALLKKTGAFSMTAVSMAGAVSHNVGQILVAMCLLTTGIVYYLIILWFTGIATGLVIGLISSLVYHRLPADIKRRR